MLGYPICGTDEQNYLKIFDWLDNGGVWPISGPGYAGLILELRQLDGLGSPSNGRRGRCAEQQRGFAPGTLAAVPRESGQRPVGLAVPAVVVRQQLFPRPLAGRPATAVGHVLAAASAWRAYRDLRMVRRETGAEHGTPSGWSFQMLGPISPALTAIARSSSDASPSPGAG